MSCLNGITEFLMRPCAAWRKLSGGNGNVETDKIWDERERLDMV